MIRDLRTRVAPDRPALAGLILSMSLAWQAAGCGDDPAGAVDAAADLDVSSEADWDAAFDVGSDAGPDAFEMDAGPDRGGVDGADLDAGFDGEDVFDPTEVDHAVETEFTPSAIAEDTGRFPLGVQAGAMRADSALLWTYAEDAATAQLRVWRPGERLSSVWLVFDERVAPSEDGYFHVVVDELAPFTTYHYAFFTPAADGTFPGRSAIGRFRTAPLPGQSPVITIGATSCTAARFQPWRVLERLSRQPLDLFIHLGDMSYNDDADTLDEYREIWRDTLSDEGYLALYASTGLYATWDDHEVDNNWDPETIDPDRLEAARRAYLETVAVESGLNGELWGSYLWGDTVEVFILDSRGERRPSTRRGPDAEYLGRAQMDWLKAGLRDSSAHFRVVMNSVPITNMPWVWDLASGDRWEGYAAQRDELLDFIVDEAIENVWFISGDFHVGFIAQVEPDGPRQHLREIAVGPAGNGPNPLAVTLIRDDQFPFATTELDLVSVLTFDPAANTVHVKFIQDGGAVLFDETLAGY